MAGIVGIYASIGEHVPWITKREKYHEPVSESWVNRYGLISQVYLIIETWLYFIQFNRTLKWSLVIQNSEELFLGCVTSPYAHRRVMQLRNKSFWTLHIDQILIQIPFQIRQT